MLILRLLVMVLIIICLMDGHAEVSSSTTGIRDRRESPAVKTNEQEVQNLDRKKKKKPKKSKKPGKKKKPNKPKPKPAKPVTTTPPIITSTLEMSTTLTLTTPTMATTASTTITTVSPTTTATTVETTTATATPALSTTTSASKTTTTSTAAPTEATTSTASTTISATTFSPSTISATTADSGAGEECKATNGKPCIFPFKDGTEEHNECKNEGGKYFWCATAVYDSGKYKYWSYCPNDGSCPLEGDGECRATNNKPCVFPFKDGKKEYNECADHGGKYFWCATGTNSAGKYTAWSECPKDGSCPLSGQITTSGMTSTVTEAATTLLTSGTSMTPDEIENKVDNSLKELVKSESKDGTLEMLKTMNKMTQTIIEDLEGQSEDNDPKNIELSHAFEGWTLPSQELLQYKQGINFGEIRKYGHNSEFIDYTVWWIGSISPLSMSRCCLECQSEWSDALFFDYSYRLEKCYCYKKIPNTNTEPDIRENSLYSTGECRKTEPILWEPGTTIVYMDTDEKIFDCEINFEFTFLSDTEEMKFRNFKSKCKESATKKETINNIGQHSFVLATKSEVYFICFFGVHIEKGGHALDELLLEKSINCGYYSNGCDDRCPSCCFPHVGKNARQLNKRQNNVRLGPFNKEHWSGNVDRHVLILFIKPDNSFVKHGMHIRKVGTIVTMLGFDLARLKIKKAIWYKTPIAVIPIPIFNINWAPDTPCFKNQHEFIIIETENPECFSFEKRETGYHIAHGPCDQVKETYFKLQKDYKTIEYNLKRNLGFGKFEKKTREVEVTETILIYELIKILVEDNLIGVYRLFGRPDLTTLTYKPASQCQTAAAKLFGKF